MSILEGCLKRFVDFDNQELVSLLITNGANVEEVSNMLMPSQCNSVNGTLLELSLHSEFVESRAASQSRDAHSLIQDGMHKFPDCTYTAIFDLSSDSGRHMTRYVNTS